MIDWLGTRLLDILLSRPFINFYWAQRPYQHVGEWLAERELSNFAVWPDGIVLNLDDNQQYLWMSDDYEIVRAIDEEGAWEAAKRAWDRRK